MVREHFPHRRPGKASTNPALDTEYPDYRSSNENDSQTNESHIECEHPENPSSHPLVTYGARPNRLLPRERSRNPHSITPEAFDRATVARWRHEVAHQRQDQDGAYDGEDDRGSNTPFPLAHHIESTSGVGHQHRITCTEILPLDYSEHVIHHTQQFDRVWHIIDTEPQNDQDHPPPPPVYSSEEVYDDPIGYNPSREEEIYLPPDRERERSPGGGRRTPRPATRRANYRPGRYSRRRR